MAVFVIGQGAGGHKGTYEIFADESITVSSTSIGFTAATYDPVAGDNRGQATYAFCTVESNSIIVRFTGGAASTGNLLTVTTSDQLILHGAGNIRNFRAIRVTNDATLRAAYGR